MGVLGDFTPAQAAQSTAAEDMSFGWFGAQIRVHPEYAELAFLDFVEETNELDGTDPRAASAVKALMRQAIHPEDFDEFWRLSRQHKQGQEQLAALNNQILAAVTERPTGLPGDSSPGQPAATRNSAGTSYGPGTAVSVAAERAAARLEAQGRPDLALVVERAREALSA